MLRVRNYTLITAAILTFVTLNASIAQDAVALLGKNLRDPAVAEFAGARLEHCYINTAGQLACSPLGVDFAFENEIIKQVRLYPNAVGAYMPYKGSLPFGLARGDTRDVVKAKLGSPNKQTADSDIYTSSNQSLIVTYYGQASSQSGLMRYLVISRFGR